MTTRRKVVLSTSPADADPGRLLQGGAGAIAATVAELEQIGVSHLVVELPGSSEEELLENSTGSGARCFRRSCMRELDFAYVGLGVHEEVVYSVAAELGYYADEGVQVSIRDGVRWDDERLRQPLSSASAAHC